MSPEVAPPPPAPAGPTGGKPAKIVGLSCPRCAGALAVEAGVRVLSCPYCGTPLLAVGEVGVRRFAVLPEVTAESAAEAVRRWWAEGFRKHPGLKREAKAAESFLCFIPFFRAQADAVGYAFGVEERRRTVGSGKNRRTQTYEVDVEKRVEKSCEKTFAAVNVAELGIRRIDLAGDALVPFDPGQLERLGMVFPATTSEAEARAEARAEFEREADPGRALKRVHFRYTALLGERFTVVYYPLWVVRYRFRERSYQAVIDGEDGRLAYGKAPGNDLFRALVLVGCQALSCLIGTTALQWAGRGSNDSAEGLIGALVVAAGILYWGWRQFRYGGVVEEGTSHEAASFAGATSELSRRFKSAFKAAR